MRMKRAIPHIGAAAALLAAAALALAPVGCAERHRGGAGAELQVKPGALVPAGSADALERYLKNGLLMTYGAALGPPRGGGIVPATVADAAEGEDFSTTNVQEAGVDEADTVKFDGTHLYVAEQPTMYYG